MTRTIQYTIFLSRPSDVESHMEAVKQAVLDANLVATPLGVRFEVFDWRTDATPGLASEPQARVNEQSDHHDALMAVIGGTLGTPTASHASGTVEEIERAITKSATSVFGQNSVMIFFKDVQLSLNSDLDEAKRVQDLKSGLGPRGILYRAFGDDDALREGVLRCIGVLIATHLSASDSGRTTEAADQERTELSPLASQSDDPPEPEELGILDYSQIITERIDAATQSTSQIQQALESLGRQTTEASSEISAAISSEDNSKKKRIINEVAKSIDACATSIEGSGEEMRAQFGGALEAIRAVIDIQASDLSPEAAIEEINIVIQMTASLDPTIETTGSQIADFGNTLAQLPRLTKELNSAKRRLLKVIEALVADLATLRIENASLHAYAISRNQSRASPALLN
ncbi:MAG: hypothetical protein EON56_03105 [Alphaproteobacteria bacterium]|nr:MAG: hypothetical protein EON56_03105 [Alphaproteobacteria bacterium]